jgi:DNA-3-methyladenine glycosylase
MDHGWDALSGTDVAAVARSLLGWRLGSGGVVVRLTEVEAYGGVGEDPPSHAYRGMTRRNAVMFGPAGVLYVYFTYGMHWCLNVVAGPDGAASAVLLRAGEVVEGAETARSRRAGAAGAVPADRDLARGPARLAAALGLDGTATGTPLLDGVGPAHLRPPVAPTDPALVRSGPRVGVSTGADTPWRFWLAGEATVSAYRRQPRRPEKPAR